MSETTKNAIFARDVQRKLDELIDWIIANSPDTKNTLTRTNFSEVRQSLYGIATSGHTNPLHIEPEPAEGGAQYINDNPAPWP